MHRSCGLRLQGWRIRASVGHGVVSTGAPTPALFGFQSPGDYATFNSNHTPDGTRRGGSKAEVFISHAHEDKELAQRLVTDIQLGLQVPAEAIRCTSVSGYDFTTGTNFVEALKGKLTGASCVVIHLPPSKPFKLRS
jgi:hypothetical protein